MSMEIKSFVLDESNNIVITPEGVLCQVVINGKDYLDIF